jgi:hypothetical protein
MKTLPLLFLSLCAYMASGQTLSDSLIAHFTMNGHGNDTIGLLVPISTVGAPLDTTDRFGVSGQAMWFDGNSFFSYGDVLDMDTADFTVALWCRVEELTPNVNHSDYPLAKGTTIYGATDYSGYAFGYRDEDPDTLSVAAGWGDQQGVLNVMSTPTNYEQWHHLALHRCDTIISLYLDGIMVQMDTLLLHSDLSTNIFFAIGAGDRTPGGSASGFFKGAIDDVRVYKGRCLSQAEIDTLAGTILTGLSWPAVNEGFGIFFFPNPTSDKITFSRIISDGIQIADQIGRIVYSVEPGVPMIDIDVSNFRPGTYFIRTGRRTGKLMVF